jgi:hypothetical protein
MQIKEIQPGQHKSDRRTTGGLRQVHDDGNSDHGARAGLQSSRHVRDNHQRTEKLYPDPQTCEPRKDAGAGSGPVPLISPTGFDETVLNSLHVDSFTERKPTAVRGT